MSMASFDLRIKNGDKLMILDNLVIDVSSFAYSHPGGQFLIDYNIGRDIGKFFYGGYALDGNFNSVNAETERHVHTNIARKIVNKLAIATLKPDAIRWNHQNKNTDVTFKIDHTNTHKINGYTRTFQFNSIDGKT